MIVQNNFIEREETNLTFTVPVSDLKRSLSVLDELKRQIAFEKVISEDNLSKVSIIGAGMRNQPGIAAKCLEFYLRIILILMLSLLLKLRYQF